MTSNHVRTISVPFALLVLLGLVACQPVATPPSGTAAQAVKAGPHVSSEDARLAAFFDEVFEREVAFSPMFQAQLGRKTRDYGKWDDFSDAADERRVARARTDLERLREEFDFDALNESSQIGYQVFEFNQQRIFDNHEWRLHNYAETQMRGTSNYLPVFLRNVHRIDTVTDAEAYIARLEGVAEVMDAVVDNLRAREARGVVSPALVFPKMIGDSRKIIAGAPFEAGDDSTLMADFRAKVGKLDVDEDTRERLVAAAERALVGPFARGYATVIAELERLQQLAEGDRGIWHLPDGAAFYANRIRNWTTVDTSADALHELGLREVKRIRAEMEEIKTRLGFAGTLAEFFAHLRSDPDNYYSNDAAGRAQYLADANAVITEMSERATGYFNLKPKAPLEVRAVESWRENSAGTAFYNAPAPDGSRPGIYYINMKDMADVQKHMMNSLAYHEAVPGHHFQITIAQEVEDLPQFRRYGGYSAYTEGWALYTERLAKEMGLYEGRPLRDFGRLAEEMKRAVRLVVDTGMHTRKWSLQQAIDYMTANTPMAAGDIQRQNERYMVLPGQALAYKVGMLEILRLRDKARKALGARFDIAAFHDAVLSNGAVPLPILETVVDNYIAANL